MFQTKQDYRINNFPDGLSCVFESWFDVITQYEEQTHGDAIYWYNERANIGAFAAALARNSIQKNISVIEEYSCMKGKGADKGLGRADLSFCYRNQWYLVESKIKWLSLTPKGRSLENINSEACKDAVRSWEQATWTMPLGMTFVVPSIQPKYKKQITECVKDIIKRIEEVGSSFDFWAYCAPGRLRELQSAKHKNYYPMVFLLANVVRRPVLTQ